LKVRFFKGIDLSKSHHSCGLKKKRTTTTKKQKDTGTTVSVSVGSGAVLAAAGLQPKAKARRD